MGILPVTPSIHIHFTSRLPMLRRRFGWSREPSPEPAVHIQAQNRFRAAPQCNKTSKSIWSIQIIWSWSVDGPTVPAVELFSSDRVKIIFIWRLALFIFGAAFYWEYRKLSR